MSSGWFEPAEFRRAEEELNLLLAEISEFEFDEYCAFNGFPGRQATDKRHVYPCISRSGYRAVSIDGQIKLFKQDGDRMIEMKAAVVRARERRHLLDFGDVRKAFNLPAL